MIAENRVCKVCLTDKPIFEFHFYAPEQPSYKCKPCHIDSERKRQKAYWANNPEYREQHNLAGKMIRQGLKPTLKPVEIKGNEKVCKECEQLKLMIEFPLRGTHRLHTCSVCYKENENLKARQKYRDDPDYRIRKLFVSSRARLKYKYKTTPEEIQDTLHKQNFKCANIECGADISLTAPKELVEQAVVDHNHATGKFRALLCQRCNLMLGMIENHPSFIKGLEDYLKTHSV